MPPAHLTNNTPRLSVVVPLYNEEESVEPLLRALREALAHEGSWEVVLVDDGSRDRTVGVARQAALADRRIRLVELARNYGQTQAMQAGFDHARGSVVVSMDGDLQNDPRDIPALVSKLEEGYDLVAGYRLRRQDRLITRKIPSFVANRLIAWLTGVRIRDNGCSLKAYRRSLLDQLDLYSDMHRFLPALSAATTGARITELPVRHHPRQFGASKYGLSRIGKILADLLTIKMIASFRERPLVLFAAGSVVALLLAFALGGYWIFATEVYGLRGARAYVLPSAAMLWLTLSFYLLMLGLIAQVALHQSRRDELRREPAHAGLDS